MLEAPMIRPLLLLQAYAQVLEVYALKHLALAAGKLNRSHLL
jgi:hypothetical protein